jgi:hypothetical protein
MVQQMAVQAAQNSAGTVAHASSVVAKAAVSATGLSVGTKVAIAAIIVAVLAGAAATATTFVGGGTGTADMPSMFPSSAPSYFLVGGSDGNQDYENNNGNGGGGGGSGGGSELDTFNETEPPLSSFPTASPTPAPECADVQDLDIFIGAMEIRLRDVVNNTLSASDISFIEDLFLIVYNSAPNRCNEFFERVMLNATATWDLVEVTGSLPYVGIMLHSAVRCYNCLIEEPLFAINLNSRSGRRLPGYQRRLQYTMSLQVTADQMSRELRRLGRGRVVYVETKNTLTNRTVDWFRADDDDTLPTETPFVNQPTTFVPTESPATAVTGFGAL